MGVLIVALISIKKGKQTKLEMKDWLPIIIGIVFFLLVIQCYYKQSSNHEPYTFPENKNCMKRECQNNQNRLVWPFPDTWYVASYVISLIFLYLYGHNNTSSIFLSLAFTITWIVSKTIYPVARSSVWCFSAAILAPIIVLINGILVKKF